MRLRQILLLMTVGAALLGGAAQKPEISLELPDVQALEITTVPSAWATANAAFQPFAFADATNRTVSCVGGFAFERAKPQYYLGDRLQTPANVDWAATCEYFLSLPEDRRAGFLFDDVNQRVYVTQGGTSRFTWIVNSGSGFVTNTLSVVASPVASGRPKNVFWTDKEWGGTVIDLTGKYVKLFGPSNLLTKVVGYEANGVAVGDLVSSNEVVKSGLYVDVQLTSKTLYAAGQLSGQVVLVYYDSPACTRIVDVQAVSVSKPDTILRYASVGDELTPFGRGYDGAGLTAKPDQSALENEDDLGPYLYQHTGKYAYSPKNKSIFALRPTDETTRAHTRTTWCEIDNQGVSWPFEVDEYRVSWSSNMPVLVRGDLRGDPGPGVTIPDVYTTVDLQKYQEDDGKTAYESKHAQLSDHAFVPTGAGRSLLKLMTDDNVWFVPVRSVLRSDTEYFDLSPSRDIPVGREMTLRRDRTCGLAKGRPFEADGTLPALLYQAASANVVNMGIYSDTGVLSGGVTSAVYAVTSDMNGTGSVVEVWWPSRYRQADMVADIAVPTLPQRWNVRWPRVDEMPTIVLAAQKGSESVSSWQRGKALEFAATNAAVRLPPRVYFGPKCGSICFWTRADDPAAATNGEDTAILSLGEHEGEPVLDIDYHDPCRSGGAVDDEGYRVSVGVSSLVVRRPRSTAPWHFVQVSWSNDVVSCWVGEADMSAEHVYANSMKVDSGSLDALSGQLTNATLGATGANRSVRIGRAVDELMFWRVPMAGDDAFLLTSVSFMADPGRETDRTLWLSFDTAETELGEKVGEDTVEFRDEVIPQTYAMKGALVADPGAPTIAQYKLRSDTVPTVYRQPEAARPGFNPNEEHAFVRAGSDAYVAWALRCDLNETINGKAPVSKPGVLVEYTCGNRARMAYFHVAVTNAFSLKFGDVCSVGRQLPGPHPFDYFPDPWLKETYWDTYVKPPFRDRKGQVWARAPGEFDIYMYYAQQDGFDWPDDLKDKYAIGDPVPWLAYDDPENRSMPDENPAPKPWQWDVQWPSEEGVPTMRIGYTLTKSDLGLPEMWGAKSMAVLYPTGDSATNVVLLTDPTVAKKVALGFKASTKLAEAGLKTGPGEKLIERIGKWYFRGVSASLSDRLYVDPTTDELVLIGKMESRAAGVNLLLPNMMSQAELDSVLVLFGDSTSTVANQLRTALDELRNKPPSQPTKEVVVLRGVTGDRPEYADVYEAPDHYALTAMGATNWVVLIENDATNSFCDAGNPISVKLLRIVPEYYAGAVATRQDENNLLSQIQTIHYAQKFAGLADGYEFEWQRSSPSTPDDWKTVYVGSNAVGKTAFDVGGQGDTLANMVNTYWRCRYRALTNTVARATLGDAWSAWSEKALAEGWLQRCLNNVTPFTQRMTDLYNNAAETAVTMLRQAGRPYQGDVALNQDNLTSVGLIELYRTLLNKAETMSLLQGVDDADANQQLLQAVERLADLYNVLGDEAYSDALNPTVGFGSNFAEIKGSLSIDYGAASSSLFCFDNQVASLLDEELALVRGRDCLSNPNGHTAPYYNRLLWNFTKGITAGEVAYAVNYGVSGHLSPTLTAATAAEQYPQGHGDAFGHYLSALQGYYRLLRNPYFSWGTPCPSQMNVADSVVNVDYYDEATFAKSAANVAKAARKAVELTALKSWRDNLAETTGGGYTDTNATNAFGYGEWAVRGAYGALCNWVVANSLLPKAETNDSQGVAYADRGLTHIDRGTVAELGALADAVDGIERTCDRMDAGRNPLGLDANAVPFDLTPIGDAKDATHFEQVRARAGQAFENARKILDRAQTYANRLKLIQEAEAGAIDNLDTMEDDVSAQLIAIYGRPYEQDVGPSGTYPQGYYGPDTYHYMWMDLAPYGLNKVDDTLVVTTVTFQTVGSSNVATSFTGSVSYALSASGVVVKPNRISGVRPASGELQIAYANFLSAYANARQKLNVYRDARAVRDKEMSLLSGQKIALDAVNTKITGLNESIKGYYRDLRRIRMTIADLEMSTDLTKVEMAADNAVVGVFGMATSALADTTKALQRLAIVGMIFEYSALVAAENTEIGIEAWLEQALVDREAQTLGYTVASENVSMFERMMSAVTAETAAVADLSEAFAALNAAQEPISKLIQDAKGIEEGRELTRQQYVNSIAKLRYNDMFFRKLRNAALSQYDAAFALAQKYTLLAAKAYAYETGSPLESSEEGRELLRAIVGARALGEVDNAGLPMVAENGDAGLSGVLAKLDANWANRKTQLGLNNPQPYATWFSLRHGLFRILPDATGDEAWQKALASYWVEDIRADAAFARHCQPFASQFGLADREPGLIIPFETTIDFACNLFGKPLAFDDAQFDSTWYATKISKAGVWFEGYNEKRADHTGASAFATTPNVYLVPVGTDRMRVPGTDANDEIVGFTVVDQTIPAPYPITASELAEANWLPTYSGETAGADAESRIRRHPSFRAYFGNRGDRPDDSALDAVRLVGRSVWNTKWLLVIPAGALNANRDQALRSFIYGLDADRDGKLDVLPVNDIRIGFKTYSAGGK